MNTWAEKLLNQLSVRFGLHWDTDATLTILFNFVVEHSTPAEWYKHLTAIAESDLEDSLEVQS